METDEEALGRETMARAIPRLVPLLFVCYLVCYVDRVNVGFASLAMNRDLAFTAAVYGLGAGIFFVSYVVLEVPSALMLHRFGARRWIARIMLTWGVISGAMAFIPQIAAATGISPQWVFYSLRFLLGAAEAGFIPGVIYYLNQWFPSAYRGRVLGYFMAALPLSSVIGAPVSGALLEYAHFPGLSSWQTLFLIEAIPAVVLAVVLLRLLPDNPAHATAWLDSRQQSWLMNKVAEEQHGTGRASTSDLFHALRHPFVLVIGFVYFGVVGMNYTLGFFLPAIVHDFGLTPLQTGFAAALPALAGAAGTVFWGRHSDQHRERRWHLVAALWIAVLCFGAAALLANPVLKMACFTLAAFGIYGCQPVLWTLPSAAFSGSALAGSIAAINAFANLSGFFGPYLMGYVKTTTGSYTGGLLIVAAVAAVAAIVVGQIDRARFGVRRLEA